MKRRVCLAAVALLVLLFQLTAGSQQPSPPLITNINVNGIQRNLRFAPYPAASSYTILSSTNPVGPFSADPSFFQVPFVISVHPATLGGYATNFGYEWRSSKFPAPRTAFYRVRVTPMSSDALLAATVLNRLTYGPTPDEVERIEAIGPDAYIAEQLAPWSFAEDVAGTSEWIPFLESKFAEATNFVYRTNAGISDLRGWHVLRAVGAKRQLLEILLQFLENHFVTEWSKSSLYFAQYYADATWQDVISAQFEYLENEKWRNALLNPGCTFYDLLKISAESPAMIIYLDTVTSRGDGNNIANENYARELMELFTMGVDNGYDQTDVTVQSRIWSGWTVEKVAFSNAFNPFAPPYTASVFPGSTETNVNKANAYGVWAFNYKTNWHNTARKIIFANKFVPLRFGRPWTTNFYGGNPRPREYQIIIPGHGVTDTNGISEGYQFLSHIANLPFSEEYISIKLCRLLVSDNFPNPSNDPSNAVYSVYNYAAGNLSPEADLVHQCMLTWETNSPKGQIWPVIQTIVNSSLFRGHGAAQQKVKTPLEYTVSAIRALRSTTNGSNLAGSFTAWTDAYTLAGSSPSPDSPSALARMGMLLFDRDSPDGYPEAGPPWISAGPVVERLRFIQSFCIPLKDSGHTDPTNDAGGCVSDIVGLLQAKTPPSTWTNAGPVADYFLHVLFPGEGAGNLALYHSLAVSFLNTDDNGNPSPFSTLTVSGNFDATYDNRVRGMVGMLMTMPRFQEQ